MRETPNGLLIDGHLATPAVARQRASEFLRDKGASPWDADMSMARAVRAWWAGDEIGFCGSEHPLAQPVTVVTIS